MGKLLYKTIYSNEKNREYEEMQLNKLCNDRFEKFINTISEEENAIAFAQEALEHIAEDCEIGRIDISLDIPCTGFTPNGKNFKGTVYSAGEDVEKEIAYTKTFHTSEEGVVVFYVYLRKDCKATKEVLNQIEVVINVVFVYVGRYRLIEQTLLNLKRDFLTGLYNADGFLEEGVKFFIQGIASEYNAFYFNLKGFRLVNQSMGYAVGDEVIKAYARELKKFINEDELVTRLGGDNFAALIRKDRTIDFLEFLEGKEVAVSNKGKKTVLSVSAVTGIYEITPDTNDMGETMQAIGTAIAIAKNVKKVPYVYFTKEVYKDLIRVKQIAAMFDSALQNEQIVVYYQPKVNVDTYSIVGAEALARWIVNGEVIQPNEFVPTLEDEGAVKKLDYYMLNHVCQDILKWLDEGKDLVRTSVNFSRKHLSNPSFAKDIIDIIDRHGVDHAYIEIEITETVDEEEQDELLEFITIMNENNIATSIDDFGTGYSSLNMLRNLPVSILKIDKSFIDNEAIIGRDRIVLSGIINMVKDLGIEVVTEGVESMEQLEFVRSLNCNVVQGYLFDKPLPKEEFIIKLDRDKYVM